MNIPTVPRYPSGIGSGRPAEPISVPWRPGVSTISYAGPPARDLPDRIARARAHHGAAMAQARHARIAGDFAGHVRALRRAELARFNFGQAVACQRALEIIWFDRSWFYFDDAEYAARVAMRPDRPMPRMHPARSRGEDITYVQRRRNARVAARRARRTPERNRELDRARFLRQQEYFDQLNYG